MAATDETTPLLGNEESPPPDGNELLKNALAKPVDVSRKEFNEAEFNRLHICALPKLVRK